MFSFKVNKQLTIESIKDTTIAIAKTERLHKFYQNK